MSVPIIGQPKSRDVPIGGVAIPTFDDPRVRIHLRADDATISTLGNFIQAIVRELDSLRAQVAALTMQVEAGALPETSTDSDDAPGSHQGPPEGPQAA